MRHIITPNASSGTKTGQGILIVGSGGQVGSELIVALRKKHGTDKVIGFDLFEPQREARAGPYIIGNALSKRALVQAVRENDVGTIYHLVSLLSARGEENPEEARRLNVDTLVNVLEIARRGGQRVFWPSSIAAFGPTTPREDVPQRTILEPTTMYGITKVTGELLCQRYHLKYGVDVRSLRYPGLISWKTPPGGGTTDYAVAIFHEALSRGAYSCFVGPGTVLPMMYMDDAIRATLELMDAPAERLTVRTSYNLGAISFSARELAEAVGARVPGFQISYAPDKRQAIADSWPRSVDDSVARRDWGWRHEFDLGRIVDEMLSNLRRELGIA